MIKDASPPRSPSPVPKPQTAPSIGSGAPCSSATDSGIRYRDAPQPVSALRIEIASRSCTTKPLSAVCFTQSETTVMPHVFRKEKNAVSLSPRPARCPAGFRYYRTPGVYAGRGRRGVFADIMQIIFCISLREHPPYIIPGGAMPLPKKGK